MDMEMLTRAWRDSVAQEYMTGEIANERSLQAALYEGLRRAGAKRVFIEPCLDYYESGGPRYRPDLVIGDAGRVKLIAELKFVPHWYVECDDEVSKFGKISQIETGRVNLMIQPENGDAAGEHEIDSETEYALFIVGQKGSPALNLSTLRHAIDEIKHPRSLWLFYGQIASDRDPEFGVRQIS